MCNYEWVKVTDNAAFAPRDGAGALVFKGKMWLLGGWNPRDMEHFPRMCNNEVWSSEDGLTWDLINENTFHSFGRTFRRRLDWEGRHSAGNVVFKDKMWIVGGDANQGHHQNDVWNSEDGKTWHYVNIDNPVPWGPRSLHQTLVFKDQIWVLGGQTMPLFADVEEKVYYDIWRSSDGVNWEKVETKSPLWEARSVFGAGLVFKDKIWILGGATYETPRRDKKILYNDVWCSEDGENWEKVADQAAWRPRSFPDTAVFDGKMWILEGSFAHEGGNQNDVWYSEDGINWHELPNTPWAPRHAASVFVYDNALWMVAGNNMESDVWKLHRK